MKTPTPAALRAAEKICNKGFTNEQKSKVAELIDAETGLPELLAALKRAEYLLSVTARYIEENPVGEYLIHYDEAECDGGALKDDCKSTAEQARAAILKAEGQQ